MKRKAPDLAQASEPREWVGGRVKLPIYIAEPTPYRPDMVLWLELPSGQVVFAKMIDPADPPVDFVESFREAVSTPLAGPAREPHTVRVGDPDLADALRQVLPQAAVEVGPTPELDQFVRMMAEEMPDSMEAEEPSYFAGGRVDSQTVEKLFKATELLHTMAPWEVIADEDVLRVDIPALGVDGGCLSVIGALKKSCSRPPYLLRKATPRLTHPLLT